MPQVPLYSFEWDERDLTENGYSPTSRLQAQCSFSNGLGWEWSMNESPDNRDPDLLPSARRKQTKGSGRVVDCLKRSETTLLKEAWMENDREDVRSAGLRCTQEAWQLKGGDERGGEKVSTDEKNSEVGHCQCRGHFAFPERASSDLGVIPDREARGLLASSEMYEQTLGVTEVLVAIAEEHLLVRNH
jgi:hypothetical protein